MRWRNLLLILAAVVVINLPAGTSLVHRHQLSADGVDVRARVLQQRDVGGDSFLVFEVPADAPERGDKGFQATVQVDRRTQDAARTSHVVVARVVPGSTTRWRVEGQVTSRAGLVLTIGADVLLVVIVALYFRFRSGLRPTLVLLADQDLVDSDEAEVLDRLGDQRYVVCGVVRAVEPDAVLLGVGDRSVRVVLDGHALPVGDPDGAPQAVRAVGTMIA